MNTWLRYLHFISSCAWRSPCLSSWPLIAMRPSVSLCGTWPPWASVSVVCQWLWLARDLTSVLQSSFGFDTILLWPQCDWPLFLPFSALVKLACMDTHVINLLLVFNSGAICIMSSITLISYTFILHSLTKQSVEGRKKISLPAPPTLLLSSNFLFHVYSHHTHHTLILPPHFPWTTWSCLLHHWDTLAQYTELYRSKKLFLFLFISWDYAHEHQSLSKSSGKRW